MPLTCPSEPCWRRGIANFLQLRFKAIERLSERSIGSEAVKPPILPSWGKEYTLEWWKKGSV